MGCCKCEEFLTSSISSCSDVVYKDALTEKEFCIFHAPPEGKHGPDGALVNAEKFNQLIFDHISSQSKPFCLGGQPITMCNISGTVFPWDITFEADITTEFPFIDFSNCIFLGKVFFFEVNFPHGAQFEKVEFHEETVFDNTLLNGVSFAYANFYSYVLFMKPHFTGTVELFSTTFHSYSTISNPIIDSTLYLNDALVTPGNVLMLKELNRNSTSKLSLEPSQLPGFKFQGCRWPSRLYIETKGHGAPSNQPDCEELYRAMKQKAAEEHDQPMVSRWHFREKLMQLKGLFANARSNDLIEVVEDREANWGARAWAWFKLLALPPYLPKLTLTGIYWATSGFGERAVRAGVWLLALVGLSFALNAIPQPMDWNTIWGSTAANATMATIPFAKDIPGDGWVKVGRGFWQFLIAVQFTLFALAVRNRFRR